MVEKRTCKADKSAIETGDVDAALQSVPRFRRDGPHRGPASVDLDLWLLHVAYQRRREPDVLARLVDEYSSYAVALAHRLHRDGEPREDLRQVALEALVGALQRFDCTRGIPFPGYATPTILGALKRHYRDQGWSVRVPRAVHEIAGPARDAAERLARRHGRTASREEVADELGVDPETVSLVQLATRARVPLSLDAPIHAASDAFVEPGATDDNIELAENHVALVAAMEHLDARSRTILGMYFFDGMCQTDIADCYGVSQMQVSRWIHAALRRLHSRMSPDADDTRSHHSRKRSEKAVA